MAIYTLPLKKASASFDKLLDNKKCRSSAQVQLEKQTAASTAAASEVKKINLAAQQKQCVAAFEDQLCKEDQQHDKDMARPDLVPQAYHAVGSTTMQQSFAMKASNIKTVKEPPNLDLTKSRSPEPESSSDEDDIEQERPVLDYESELADMGPAEQDYVSSEGRSTQSPVMVKFWVLKMSQMEIMKKMKII
ncbi:hypothetical protein BYT27DRAFT_7212387 [Phlegmacium glaucopus]|nr:hypothetical protein BYT27DRAFT_7212387 [Phlegmacium glaucopus]